MASWDGSKCCSWGKVWPVGGTRCWDSGLPLQVWIIIFPEYLYQIHNNTASSCPDILNKSVEKTEPNIRLIIKELKDSFFFIHSYPFMTDPNWTKDSLLYCLHTWLQGCHILETMSTEASLCVACVSPTLSKCICRLFYFNLLLTILLSFI